MKGIGEGTQPVAEILTVEKIVDANVAGGADGDHIQVVVELVEHGRHGVEQRAHVATAAQGILAATGLLAGAQGVLEGLEIGYPFACKGGIVHVHLLNTSTMGSLVSYRIEQAYNMLAMKVARLGCVRGVDDLGHGQHGEEC